MNYLLDTDTVINLFQGNELTHARIVAAGDPAIFISAITIAELFYGAYNSKNREQNIQVLRQFTAESQIVPLNPEIAEIFGMLKAELKAKGRIIGDSDLFIAATSLALQAVLVTGNLKHFSRIPDLQLENWIQPEE